MTINWNNLEQILAELPQGPGMLEMNLHNHRLTGKEHGHTVAELTPHQLIMHMPETVTIDLNGLNGAGWDRDWLVLDMPGYTSRVHAGKYAPQLAEILSRLLEPANPEEVLFQSLLSRAEKGDHEAMSEVALCYQTGKGTAVHEGYARMWKERAAKARPVTTFKMKSTPESTTRQQNARQSGLVYQQQEEQHPRLFMSGDDLWLQAQDYKKVNDHNEEIKSLKRAAELSHPKAHFQLATYLATGMNGLKADPEQAFAHMLEAAQLLEPDAPYYVGIWYKNGFGTKKDLISAEEWLLQDDSPKALMQLALLYGDDLHQYETAIHTAKTAAAASEVAITQEVAEKKIARWRKALEEDRQARQKNFRIGQICHEAQAYDLSLEFFEKAARQGSDQAAYMLAIQLLEGQGTDPDKERAKALFEEVKDRQPESLYYLTYLEEDKARQKEYGEAYLKTAGDKNRQEQVDRLLHPAADPMEEYRAHHYDKAVDGLKKLAEGEDENGQANAALAQIAIENGSLDQAAPYLKKAIEKGNAAAATLRKELYAKAVDMFEKQEDAGQAAAYLQLAAETGENQAALLLGQAMLESEPDKAIPLLQQASATEPDAIALLGYACMYGLGVAKNEYKAHRLIHQALLKGSTLARRWSIQR